MNNSTATFQAHLYGFLGEADPSEMIMLTYDAVKNIAFRSGIHANAVQIIKLLEIWTFVQELSRPSHPLINRNPHPADTYYSFGAVCRASNSPIPQLMRITLTAVVSWNRKRQPLRCDECV